MDTSFRISSAAVTDRGLSEKRPQNEDSYLEIGQCGIFAVADGVGGAQAGDVASQMAMEILGEAFTNLPEGADAEEVMQTALERANSSIFQMAHELHQLSNMATTVVALHLAGNIATIGHVGDSRLYRVDAEGNLYRETDDHSMVADEVRAGRMTEEQAENHPSRNIINRALGAEPTVAVELKTIMVEPGTSFLICSDGITRHVGDQEIKGVLTFGGEPSEICDYLKGLCYQRGAEDNLTAVVIKVYAAADKNIALSDADADYLEETTIATARAPFDRPITDYHDEEPLELATQELKSPESTDDALMFEEVLSSEITEPITPATFDTGDFSGQPIGVGENTVADEPPAQTEPSESATQPDGPSVEIENEAARREPAEEKHTLSRIASAVGMLLIGGVIGMGIYYFVLAPRPLDTSGPQLSEMRSANIPLSAFEENRRNVDRDPAGYIARFGKDPQDSEDYYLLGRAYVLSGDYPRARIALTESRNRLSEADPVNAKILASDIAMALAVTNDTTIQSMLRKEIDATLVPQANSNISSNR